MKRRAFMAMVAAPAVTTSPMSLRPKLSDTGIDEKYQALLDQFFNMLDVLESQKAPAGEFVFLIDWPGPKA